MMLDTIAGAQSTTPGDYRETLASICADLAEFFGSTIGNGMSKLIEDPHGNFVVASDGDMLVRELYMRYKHPIVTTLLEAGAEQGRRCGDLVKTTVTLACRLVLSGLALMRQGVHPNAIQSGFSGGLNAARNLVQASASRAPVDTSTIETTLSCFLAHRLSPGASRHVAQLVASHLGCHLARIERGGMTCERAFDTFIDTLDIVLDPGGNIVDSRIVQGAAIIKDPLNWQTGWTRESLGRLENARIAMLSGELYFDKKKRGETIDVILHDDTPARFKAGIDESWARKARAITSRDVRVLITEKGIDDALVSALNAVDPPVLAFRRAKPDEMKRVARHVGATISHDIDTLEDKDIGFASCIEPLHARAGTCFVFRNDNDPGHNTIIIRGSMYDVCDTVKHHLLAAVKHCIDVQLNGLVPRFPWFFLGIARDVHARQPGAIPSRARLAMDAFLQELAWLPRLVQANRGLDPLALPPLNASQGSSGSEATAEPASAVAATSVEHMLTMATVTASRLLRVDSMILNPSGWRKRAGQEQRKNDEHEKKD